MNKKGFYFTVDALISLIILSVGFLVITSNYSYAPTEITTHHLADDILNFMQSAKVSDFCEVNYCNINFLDDLEGGYGIKNYNNTLLELVGELAYRGLEGVVEGEEKAEELINKLLTDYKIIPSLEIYHFAINLTGKNVFVTSVIDPDTSLPPTSMKNLEEQDDYKKTELLVSSKRIIMGYYIEGVNVDYWGPYVVEVRIWKK